MTTLMGGDAGGDAGTNPNRGKGLVTVSDLAGVAALLEAAVLEAASDDSKPPIRAVCFDLFGTLLQYDEATGSAAAEALGLSRWRVTGRRGEERRRALTASAALAQCLQRAGGTTGDFARVAMTSGSLPVEAEAEAKADAKAVYAAYLDRLADHAGVRLPDAERAVLIPWLQREVASVGWIEPGSVSALQRLPVALAVCSNLAEPFALAATALLQAVVPARQQVMSCWVGAVKPARAIYAVVLSRLREVMPDLQPEQVLFIGDKTVEDALGPLAFGFRVAWMRRSMRSRS